MYKALNYWVFGGFSGERTPYEFIDFAAKNELDGIELTVGDAIKVDVTEEECHRIAAYAKERNVGLRTLATGMYGAMSIGATDENERLKAVEFTKKYITIAKWIGAKVVLVIPGSTFVAWAPERPVFPYRGVWEKSTESLKELIPFAEAAGIEIALENVWTRFLMSPMEWKLFLDQFDSKNVGVYFDTGNCCLYCKPEDYIEILADRIKAVHFKNFKGGDCGGGLHGFGDDLFDGEIDFKKLIGVFGKYGYDRTFTVEMIPFCRLPDMVLPDAALAQKMADQIKSL
ncbi:MAG: sugar phosphate isomerase/epimerase [Victivallaceae bacterium]|nr:sugar phosphate isomerase/epimerase [Victivallaceae bacterium]